MGNVVIIYFVFISCNIICIITCAQTICAIILFGALMSYFDSKRNKVMHYYFATVNSFFLSCMYTTVIRFVKAKS